MEDQGAKKQDQNFTEIVTIHEKGLSLDFLQHISEIAEIFGRN